MLKIVRATLILGVLIAAGFGAATAADPIPLIDAHSQADKDFDVSAALKLMEQGGVRRTILSSRGGLTPNKLVAMAAAHPDRITASMEVKSQQHYMTGTPEFFRRLAEMEKEPRYGAISEALLFHAEKGTQPRRGGQGAERRGGQAQERGGGQEQGRRGDQGAERRGGQAQERAGGQGQGRRDGQGQDRQRETAPEFNLSIDSPQVEAVLQVALRRNWPFVAHYEFRSLNSANYTARMAELKRLLKAHPSHPIVLIHMGQLHAGEAAALISEFRNIYFMTSHSNPLFEAMGGGFSWTKLFEGRKIAPAWRALFVAHPDRFILGFDNVLKRHWEPTYYLAQARLWQDAFADLPPEVAHAVAHRNAERLWRLPPVK